MLKTRLMTGLATVAVLVPQLAFAATPQQMLDRAVRLRLGMENPIPQAMTIDMNMHVAYQPSRSLSRKLIEESGARTTTDSLRLQVVIEGELFPRAGSITQDAQGRIRLVKLVSTGAQVMDLSNLAIFEWKTIDEVFYVRIAEVSPALREELSSIGADLSLLEGAIGMWLKFDPDALADFAKDGLPLGANSTFTVNPSIRSWESLGRMLPLLQVVRVEKKVTRGTEVYSRMAVRLHPGFWTRLEQQLIKMVEEELADLKTSSPREYTKQRTQRIREIRTSLQASRLKVNKLRLVVMINDRTGRVERVEGAFQDKSPSYAYVYRGNKAVKIVQGQETINIQFAGGMRGIEAKTLVEPTPFVTLQDLIQRFMNMRMDAMSESMEESEMVLTP